ncbi:MAG: aminodeoxychorismate synthase component I [Campylobacterota bacterium]|nr:aminodeoxychorismate synthase component I [Campylobacterota bacterium]
MSHTVWLEHPGGIRKITQLGKERRPFLFLLSYDKQKIFAQPLDELDEEIFYKLETLRNYPPEKCKKSYYFFKSPVPFNSYQERLKEVIKEIRSGNTYLLNLTFKTPIESDLTLKEIFACSRAKFKLYFKGEFICFSPERFIEISHNTIAAYPMKGTIEASLPNAEREILSNPKEMAEHVMIVDLMRNDLGIVGRSVKVEKFRYIDKIRAGEKELLQVSSRITAVLPDDWRDQIGTILDRLTPAGSITGTPKKSTTEIIQRVENYARGFYTGIFGIFDGESLRSGVMIRFIEKENGKLFYKSGGGITIDSDARSEYAELIDKIYLPF